MSDTLKVTAGINSGCIMGGIGSDVTTFGTFNFGIVTTLKSDINVASSTSGGTIAVKCTSGLSYTIALDAGQNTRLAHFTKLRQGQRQMIRLVKKTAVVPGEERAYRVIIDEIAQDNKETDEQAQQQLAMGLNLKMRYILPLFVSGKGVWTVQDPKADRDLKSATMPQLSYRLLTRQGKQYLEVNNSGRVHARLTAVNLIVGNNKSPIAEGLLGYVLPGVTMRWPLPQNRLLSQSGQLEAMVNAFPEPIVIEKH